MENGVVRVALFLWLAVYVSCMNNTCTNINVTCEDLHMCGVEAVCISEPQAGNDTCNITTNFNGMVKLHENQWLNNSFVFNIMLKKCRK